EAVPLIDAPWAIAASLDFVYPQTRGQRPADFEGTQKFGLALNRVAARDPAVHKLHSRSNTCLNREAHFGPRNLWSACRQKWQCPDRGCPKPPPPSKFLQGYPPPAPS